MAESVLIVGSGALATLFAARLAASGVAVQLLAGWPEGLAALQRNGATLVDVDGEARYPVQASDNPADFKGARLALVLVKSWQTERAAQQLTACLDPQGLALSLQNGLGNYEILVDYMSAERVALGSTTTGASLVDPGRVRAGGEGHIVLGEHPRLAPLHELLILAGFDVRLAEDLDALLWGKLAINAAINPLTALLELPNGALLEREEYKAWMRALANEVAAVAQAQDIRLPFDDAYAAAIDVATRTAENHSSMLQDIQRGAPTEIEAICGAVVQAGQAIAVPTPANQAMLELVRAKVRCEDLHLEAIPAIPLP